MARIDADVIQIDKNFLFKYITEQDIFEKYLNTTVEIGEWYTNPLRNDNKADCTFFYGDRTQRLWFVDFAGKSYDCFNIVETLYKCGYYKACQIIAVDFGLLKGKTEKSLYVPTSQEKFSREPVILRVKAKKYFSSNHLNFWKQFIDLPDDELVNELLVGGIRPIETAWLESSGKLKCIYEYRKDKPAFVYELGEGYSYEFYFPFADKNRPKHLHSTNSFLHYYSNLQSTGQYVVITKSRKDAFIMRYFGINTIGVMTERRVVDKEIMLDLQSRFDYVFTLFDSDKTGYHLSWRMRKIYGTIALHFPKDMLKDFSDNLLEYGKDNMIELIEETKTYYSID